MSEDQAKTDVQTTNVSFPTSKILSSHTLRTQDPYPDPPHPLCQYSNGPASSHDVPSQLACHGRERRDASNVSAFEGNRERKPVDLS